jgi:hypothetical protein
MALAHKAAAGGATVATPHVYLGNADWLPCNLYGRIETVLLGARSISPRIPARLDCRASPNESLVGALTRLSLEQLPTPNHCTCRSAPIRCAGHSLLHQ